MKTISVLLGELSRNYEKDSSKLEERDKLFENYTVFIKNIIDHNKCKAAVRVQILDLVGEQLKADGRRLIAKRSHGASPRQLSDGKAGNNWFMLLNVLSQVRSAYATLPFPFLVRLNLQ